MRHFLVAPFQKRRIKTDVAFIFLIIFPDDIDSNIQKDYDKKIDVRVHKRGQQLHYSIE